MSLQGNYSNLEPYWEDDFSPLHDAGKELLTALRDDENAADADLYRRIGYSGIGSHQYYSASDPLVLRQAAKPSSTDTSPRSLFEDPIKLPSIAPPTICLRHERSEPLPPYMAEQLKEVEHSSFMGLLPEAELAWMSVDDKLFIWPYNDVDSRIEPFFTRIKIPSRQCVVSVGLVPPKRGLKKLQGSKWCLLVTTPDEVHIYCLAGDNQSLKVRWTGYSIPTDGVKVTSICGTSDGRIFLGKEDGCLEEFLYPDVDLNRKRTAPFAVDGQLKEAHDEVGDANNTTDHASFLRNGKRILFGTEKSRPSKCRKLSHSQRAGSVISAIVPDFLVKLIGTGQSSTRGGKIVKMVVDEERSCLYTLGDKGWICAFSLLPNGTEKTVKLVAAMDTPETARKYLDAVARQQMNPPQSRKKNIGRIVFPGGDGSAAQKGVGGMEGAREILSLAEGKPSESILIPISLHVVPQDESGRITLVAATKGGLRYFISSLSSNILTAGPPRSNVTKAPLAPSPNGLCLCHIRAPPPLTEGERSQDISTTLGVNDAAPVGGFVPKVSAKHIPKVEASFCTGNAMVLAVEDITRQQSDSSKSEIGNRVLAVFSDFVHRNSDKAPGGVSETFSCPLSQHASIENSKLLPGGIVWDIEQTSPPKNKLLTLSLNSQTPTDRELGVGMVPEFIPEAKSAGVTSQDPFLKVATKDSKAARNTSIVSSGGNTLYSTGFQIAFNMMSSLIFSRPALNGVSFQMSRVEGAQNRPMSSTRYFLSEKPGVAGFSLSAADIPANKARGASMRVSARLNPWLLRPSITPLNILTTQHLRSTSRIVALNAGGLQYFLFTSILDGLERALLAAGANVERDENVTIFFSSYGYAEGCAMCIILALRQDAALRGAALQAALQRALTPILVSIVPGKDALVQDAISRSETLLPNGYIFRPSALLMGIMKVASRVLRPIWYKPLVVVTEGRMILRGWKQDRRATPAKVELLLDDQTLSEMLQQVSALVDIMKECFSPAIDSVPGVQRQTGLMMDIDEVNGNGGLFLTDAMRHKSQSRDHLGVNGKDLESLARLTEERKIHSLFRLVSRSVQLLRLMSLLANAHAVDSIPEVEWGLLHGLTTSQLVQTRDGQQRIEKILNSLVASTADFNLGHKEPSVEADSLATQLACQCYLYFSPGSHFSYLGFSLGSRALAIQTVSREKLELARKSAECFLKAARHWHDSALVTGRSTHAKEFEGYDQVARAAHDGGSPLAKAVTMLVELRNVRGVVEVCISTASNFDGKVNYSKSTAESYVPPSSLPWELNLYHKKQKCAEQTSSSPGGSTSTLTPTSSIPSSRSLGRSVTHKDAVMTCWSLIFYHLSLLLQRGNDQILADEMVSCCAAETDTSFTNAFFRYMQESGNTATLLRINSAALENWLILDLKNPDVLYSYYFQQKRFFSAGKVVASRAMDSTVDLPLSERIQCLSRAKGAYSAGMRCLREGSFFEDVDLNTLRSKEKEAEEFLELAKLQSRILESVTGSKSKAKEMEQLKSKLLEVSDLFNLTWEYDLPEIGLLLMVFCKTDDHDAATRCWRFIFCEQVLPCCTWNDSVYRFLYDFDREISTEVRVFKLSNDSTPEELCPTFEGGAWIQKLERKVIAVGKDVYGQGADFVLPLECVLADLEGLRRVLKDAIPDASLKDDWSMNILAQIGVPYLAIIDVYERLANQDEQRGLFGDGEARRLDQLSGIVALLSRWMIAIGEQGKVPLQQLSQAVHSFGLHQRLYDWKAESEGLKSSRLSDDFERISSEVRSLINQQRSW